jgi:hypothetical protein
MFLQVIAVQYIATVKDKDISVFNLWNTKLYLKILLMARCVSITKTNKTADGNNAFIMKILQNP